MRLGLMHSSAFRSDAAWSGGTHGRRRCGGRHRVTGVRPSVSCRLSSGGEPFRVKPHPQVALPVLFNILSPCAAVEALRGEGLSRAEEDLEIESRWKGGELLERLEPQARRKGSGKHFAAKHGNTGRIREFLCQGPSIE